MLKREGVERQVGQDLATSSEHCGRCASGCDESPRPAADLDLLPWTGLDRPLRRRVLGLVASAVTLVVTANLSLDHAFAGAVFVWPAVIPHSVQWPLVVLAPAVVLLVSALVIRLRERDRPAHVA
jgi:hypothetical protein